MDFKSAAIIAGVVAACAPALAPQTHAREPNPAVVALQNTSGPAVEPANSARRHRPVKAARKHPAGEASVARQEDDSTEAPPHFSESIGWRLTEDRMTGARLGLPEKLVPRASTTRSGSRWTSAQGQIQVETFRLAEASLPALFEEEKKANRRQIESSDLKSDSFVVTGTQGLKNFLVRAAARGSEVRGLTVLYDQATQGTMESVAHAMAAAFTAFPDPNAPAPPGIRRAVEYGSAIVVDAGGDLVAPAHLTADCRTITVPPFGHAVRLAADQTSDLALIRLYGVRNLVPVQFGEGNESGDLTADRCRRSACAGRFGCRDRQRRASDGAWRRSGAEAGIFRRRGGRFARSSGRNGRFEVGNCGRERRRRAFCGAGAGRHHSRFPAGPRCRPGRDRNRTCRCRAIGAADYLCAAMTIVVFRGTQKRAQALDGRGPLNAFQRSSIIVAGAVVVAIGFATARQALIETPPLATAPNIAPMTASAEITASLPSSFVPAARDAHQSPALLPLTADRSETPSEQAAPAAIDHSKDQARLEVDRVAPQVTTAPGAVEALLY